MITFEEYVRLRGARLVGLARLLIHDRHLAEDLVQDVLGRAYPRWHRITRNGEPDAYVRRMLVNAHISWLRRRSSHEFATGEIADRADGRDVGGAAADRDAAWRLVAGLPPKQRATLVLRYYEDLDDTSIAEILHCSPSTVRTQAKRALDTLRHRLEEPAALLQGGTRR